MPAGVPGATFTEVPERVIPALVDDTKVVFTWAAVTGAPFKVSFTKTLATAVPPVNPLTVPASVTASIGAAVTVIVTTAWSQLVGFIISQIW